MGMMYYFISILQVNLGVVKENPSTCRGVIEIMKYLHQYVPVDCNNVPFQIICHGDQISVERMIDAKLAMAGSELPATNFKD